MFPQYENREGKKKYFQEYYQSLQKRKISKLMDTKAFVSLQLAIPNDYCHNCVTILKASNHLIDICNHCGGDRRSYNRINDC